MAAPSSSNSSSSSSPASSSSKSPPSPPPQPSLFTPIQECDDLDETPAPTAACTDATAAGSSSVAATPPAKKQHQHQHQHQHQPTPLHHKNGKPPAASSKTRQQNDEASVSCNKCRPHAREKISNVVPLDNNGVHAHNVNKHGSSAASPNGGIFKSIISSLTRRSPKPSAAGEPPSTAAREEQWKIAVAELSHKLIQATRKRDEAVLEASRLKYSMAELEKKLNKLEGYCHVLKSGLDECSTLGNISASPFRSSRREKEVVDNFLVAVAEARTSVRLLSRSLTMQLRHMGAKVYERIAVLLQPYDGAKIAAAASKNPRALLFYLEALLNKAFFEDFEAAGFQRGGSWRALNPGDRCEANYASFGAIRGLTWEDVLSRGTRHFSEEFSGFCDRKMSEIVAMLGWNRAWPEPLLQAFFGASKGVWLVHLLANSVQPAMAVFRVDKDAGFDAVYMEDMGGDKARRLVPSVVRMMVAPGFYVCGSVVKCRVLCRYTNDTIIRSGNNNVTTKGLISSP